MNLCQLTGVSALRGGLFGLPNSEYNDSAAAVRHCCDVFRKIRLLYVLCGRKLTFPVEVAGLGDAVFDGRIKEFFG
ncbi:hypothetical protein Ae717Ps2_3935c [Pseudonocardia sp. Ae717_Ps2]|nr:hypothetical protein Ae717Ps2_3935c [Pseudonocardia sp. Ae717_Ps2]